MRRLGIWLGVIGLLGLILPQMGLQLRILSIFGRSTPAITGVLLVVGIILVVISFVTAGGVKQNETSEEVIQESETE